MTCRMKGPDELANDTVTVGDGTVYVIPPTSILAVKLDHVKDMMTLGFWPYREVDEQFEQGNLGGSGGVPDPGDLTVYFDNKLV